MALITPELKEQMAQVGVLHLATASKAGVPNVAPMGAILVEEDTIFIANNFMNKTMANILENPQVSVLVWSRDIGNCFQLKGTAEIMKDTEEHQKMRDMLEAKKPGAYPCHDLVVISEIKCIGIHGNEIFYIFCILAECFEFFVEVFLRGFSAFHLFFGNLAVLSPNHQVFVVK